jgi:hypothetical protein
MQEIITGIKRDDGVQVVWYRGTEARSTLFSYNELLAMRINVLDLLERPERYLLDLESHRIVRQ